MGKNRISYVLMGMSAAFFVGAGFIPQFPFFIFAALAPLFLLFEHGRKENAALPHLFGRIFIVLLVSFLAWNTKYTFLTWMDWMVPLIHALAITLAFVVFHFTDKHAKNRLGVFTLIIYWLAMEFLLLQGHPAFARFFLASAFDQYPGLIGWNAYTGFLGVSLWILIVNVLLFYSVFAEDRLFKGKISWPGLAGSLLLGCLPVFFGADTIAIVREDLVTGDAMSKQLAGSGEYIGKTAVWVAVLLLLYSFVRREVKDQ